MSTAPLRPDSPHCFPLPTPEDFEGLAKLGERISDLSERQQAILAWLSQGVSNLEISRILKLSRNTVESEISLIFNELGVENRMAASAICIQRRLRNDRKARPRLNPEY
ncbi:MAG: helix-turn-helix transcriptional regulator [Verrucomicrobiota bacterium]